MLRLILTIVSLPAKMANQDYDQQQLIGPASILRSDTGPTNQTLSSSHTRSMSSLGAKIAEEDMAQATGPILLGVVAGELDAGMQDMNAADLRMLLSTDGGVSIDSIADGSSQPIHIWHVYFTLEMPGRAMVRMRHNMAFQHLQPAMALGEKIIIANIAGISDPFTIWEGPQLTCHKTTIYHKVERGLNAQGQSVTVRILIENGRMCTVEGMELY